MQKIRKVGVVCDTRYTGVELLRLQAGYSKREIACITSHDEAGMPIIEMILSLRGYVELDLLTRRRQT